MATTSTSAAKKSSSTSNGKAPTVKELSAARLAAAPVDTTRADKEAIAAEVAKQTKALESAAPTPAAQAPARTKKLAVHLRVTRQVGLVTKRVQNLIRFSKGWNAGIDSAMLDVVLALKEAQEQFGKLPADYTAPKRKGGGVAKLELKVGDKMVLTKAAKEIYKDVLSEKEIDSEFVIFHLRDGKKLSFTTAENTRVLLPRGHMKPYEAPTTPVAPASEQKVVAS